MLRVSQPAPGIRAYLEGLASLCREVAGRPELLPLFIAIIMMAPQTIMELVRERRRIAA